ncbi:MAG: FHA domain-containing protein [Prevotellaceae bacterium]|jgi:hypothetical protein|nr:FHA domain-containing protein [Prevotellaceae bacterium]
MKKLCTIALLTLCVSGLAQNAKKDIDASAFPTISFVWDDYVPEVKTERDFILTDNGVQRDFQLTYYQEEKNKSVLFLWEDMSSNGVMYGFTRNVLLNFFKESALRKADKFSIAVFNRERNNENLLKSICGFTADKSVLSGASKKYIHNTVAVAEQPQYSDLYKAIYKGMDLLSAEPIENVKVMIVFTVGWNLRGGGAQSELAAVEQKAKEKHIPVYVVLYPIHGEKLEINTLADDTYGKYVATGNAVEAEKQLFGFYKDLNKRHSPHEYTFTFETDKKQDGKLHNIAIVVTGSEQVKHSFSAPSFSLIIWAKEHIVPTILIIAAILALIVLIVWFIIKNQKKKEALRQVEIAQRKRDKEETDRKQRELEEKIQREKEDKERKEDEAKEQDLLNLMRTKNLYPRLQCVVGNNKFVHYISQVRTTIGRNDDNDLELQHQTVSREHAIINFTGEGFEITNLSKANQLIINGRFVEHAILKNTDIIGLGEAVITFYL